MERYNYQKAVSDDVLEYVRENVNFRDFWSFDQMRESLLDALWTEDSVTGNASGSYTFSAWAAEENLAHNLDLLRDAAEEFGGDLGDMLQRGAEYCDVCIRCYLLDSAVDEVLEDLRDEWEAAQEEEDATA